MSILLSLSLLHLYGLFHSNRWQWFSKFWLQIEENPRNFFTDVLEGWDWAVDRMQQMTKVASLRTIVLGAPLREILKHLASRTVAPDADNLVALLHRPRQSYFLIPQVGIPPQCGFGPCVWILWCSPSLGTPFHGNDKEFLERNLHLYLCICLWRENPTA